MTWQGILASVCQARYIDGDTNRIDHRFDEMHAAHWSLEQKS